MIDAFSDASVEQRHDSTNPGLEDTSNVDPDQNRDIVQEQSNLNVSENACVVDKVTNNVEFQEQCHSPCQDNNVLSNKTISNTTERRTKCYLQQQLFK